MDDSLILTTQFHMKFKLTTYVKASQGANRVWARRETRRESCRRREPSSGTTRTRLAAQICESATRNESSPYTTPRFSVGGLPTEFTGRELASGVIYDSLQS